MVGKTIFYGGSTFLIVFFKILHNDRDLISCKDIFVIRKTICATEFSKLRFVTCKSTIIGNLLRKRRNDILEYIDYVC